MVLVVRVTPVLGSVVTTLKLGLEVKLKYLPSPNFWLMALVSSCAI